MAQILGCPIQPLAWELPYIAGVVLKRKKSKKKKKKKSMILIYEGLVH